MTSDEREPGTGPAPTPPAGFFHPSRPGFRFSVLFFAALLTFGNYFAYDSISGLAPRLLDEWGVDRTQIGWLYTVYSLAAIVSVLVAGILIDRIGTRRASVLLSAIIVAGACIFAAAPNMTVASVGRFVFGAGSEALIVAQNAMLTRWFRNRELALSFGLTLTLARFGTLCGLNGEPVIAQRYGVGIALWVAAGMCVLSFLSNLVYYVLDRKGEKVLGLKEVAAGDRIVLSDIRRFGASYWYIALLCVTFYSAIFPFTALSTDFFKDKWLLPETTDDGGSLLRALFRDLVGMGSTAAGTTSIITFASMIFAPFAGSLVDRFGRRVSLMMVGSVLMVPVFLILGFTRQPPWLPMVILGAAFVLVPAAMWPAVPLVVEKGRVGTAFGLMTMIQNIGLALFSWLNGALRDETQGYEASMVMFASLGVAGLVLAFLLKRADLRAGSVLDRRRTG